MAVPVRVLWNLRISTIEKLSIGVVFIVGIFTMVTAIIRSVSLESSASSGQVSTTWLMLVCSLSLPLKLVQEDQASADIFSQWAGIEGAVGMHTQIHLSTSSLLQCTDQSSYHCWLPPVLRHLHPRPSRSLPRSTGWQLKHESLGIPLESQI